MDKYWPTHNKEMLGTYNNAPTVLCSGFYLKKFLVKILNIKSAS